MPTHSLAIQVRKEARALLPWWMGVALTTTVTAIVARRNSGYPNFRNDQEIWVAIVHALGILAVAAVSIGHELTHGTLSSLLVQPVSRLKTLATKLGVLIPAVVTLGLVGNAFYFSRYVPASAEPLIIWGPVAIGIGLVPLLTVLTRKPLGGVVFAMVVPGVILMVSERIFSLGEGTPAFAITWYGTLLVSAVGILALFYRFPRIEAAGEGGARTADASATTGESAAGNAAVASTRATPRHWVWLLVKKEMRLQQLTFAVSALGILVCAAVIGAKRTEQDFLAQALETLAGMHACFIVVLAGAFSTAEERQMGTLTPQLLQPKAAWRQFATKMIVTAGLAGALAFGLPLLFKLLGQPVDPFEADAQFVVPLVLMFCAAVYASSLTTNGLWALLGTFPVMAASIALGAVVIDPLRRMLWEWFQTNWKYEQTIWEAIRKTDKFPEFRALMRQAWTIQRELPVYLAIGGGLLVLYFAARNYRSLERGARIVGRQVSVLVLYFVTAAVIQFAVPRLWQWWIYRSYS